MNWVVSLKIFDPHNQTQPTYEKLMEHLTDYCDENLMDRLVDTEYIKKIESEVNNYVHLYIICDDTEFNWLM